MLRPGTSQGARIEPGRPPARVVHDRRRTPTPMLSWFTFFGGRRRETRRDGEAAVFVDQHGHGLFLVVTSVVALNVIDAFFTVYFLSYGGTEMNPLVDYLLRFGTWPFLLAKSIGIGACLGFLTLAKNFRAARIGLGLVLGGYVALLCWHFYLLAALHKGDFT